jgi:hypothetical protein
MGAMANLHPAPQKFPDLEARLAVAERNLAAETRPGVHSRQWAVDEYESEIAKLREQLLSGDRNFAADQAADQDVEPPAYDMRTKDLALALGRSPRTVRRWITELSMPDAPFRAPGGKRWWTTAHVAALASAAREAGLLDDHHLSPADTSFPELAHQAFKRLR